MKHSDARDMTQGRILPVFLLFCVPVLIGNLFQALYNIADSVIVGRILGANSLAAIGATSMTTSFFLNIAFAFASAYSIIMSQSFGSGDEKRVRTTLTSAIWISGCMTLLLAVLGVTLARPLMRLLNTPESIIDESVLYIRICVGLGVGQILYNSVAAVLRSVGDSRTPLYFLIISAVLNVGLDLLFVAGFHTGVGGAALATVISQFLAGIGCTIFMLIKHPIFRLKRSELKPDPVNIKITVHMGVVLGLQIIFTLIGEMFITRIINSFGTDAVAANTAVARIQQFATLFFASIANSMSVFIGQNVGADRFDRVKKGVRQLAAVVLCLTFVCAVAILLFGRYFIGLFISSSDAGYDAIMSFGVTYQVISACFYPSLGLIWLFNSTLRGAGETTVPLISGWVELIIKCGGSWLFAHFWGWTGMCFGNPIGWFLGLLPSFFYYWKGNWQRHSREILQKPDEKTPGDL